MAEDEEKVGLVQAAHLFVTEQEYELFNSEGINAIGKYNVVIDGKEESIYVLHLYPVFLGMKESYTEIAQKNNQLFQMLNTLNNVMLAMRTEIKNLNEEVAELKAKRIVH